MTTWWPHPASAAALVAAALRAMASVRMCALSASDIARDSFSGMSFWISRKRAVLAAHASAIRASRCVATRRASASCRATHASCASSAASEIPPASVASAHHDENARIRRRSSTRRPLSSRMRRTTSSLRRRASSALTAGPTAPSYHCRPATGAL